MRLFPGTGSRQRAMRVRSRDSLQGQMLDLAIPAVGEQLLNLMVGLVDTFLVGHLGKEALAAVGLANQWVMMATSLFGAVAVGTTALIARAVGAQDRPLANRALLQSILLGALIGLLTTAPCLALAGPAIALLGAEADTLPLATSYLRIVASIFFLSTLMFVANAAMRGAGDTRTPLAIMLVVNGLNALVAWLLINGIGGLPQLGVAGSAVGAAVGRATGGVLAIGLLLRGRRGLRLSLTRLRPDLGLVRRILRVGLPSGIEQLFFRLGQMAFFSIVAGLGTAALATQHVAMNATSISFLPGFGFAAAATTLVGHNLGAKDPRRAERSGYLAFLWGAGIMLIIGAFLIAFPSTFVRFFTEEAEVVAMGVRPLRIIGLAQPLLAAMMIFAGALRGAGDTRAPLWINGISLWLFRLPAAALLSRGWAAFLPPGIASLLPSWLAAGPGLALPGAWIAMAADLSIRGAVMFLRFRGGRWKKAQV